MCVYIYIYIYMYNYHNRMNQGGSNQGVHLQTRKLTKQQTGKRSKKGKPTQRR